MQTRNLILSLCGLGLLLVACDDGPGSASDAAAGDLDASPRSADSAVPRTDASGPAVDGGANTDDPFEAQRQLCVDTINELRAERGLPPFERWLDEEPCADMHAEDDQATNMPHAAWRARKFGCTTARNQNECLGGGVASCIRSMWRERDLPGCATCDECSGDHGCEGCDFYGRITGNVCGHYENLSATSWTRVACGFGGGWVAINFR